MTRDTPIAAAEAMFDALNAKRFDAVAALTHPLALARFKKTQSAFVQIQAISAQFADDWEARTGCETPAPDAIAFLNHVLGVPSPEELERTEPATLLVRWLSTIYGRAGRRVSTRTVIGAMPDGDGEAHVLFREEDPIVEQSPGPWRDMVASTAVRVLTTVKGPDGGWYVMLNGGIVFDESGSMISFGWGGEDDPRAPAA